LIAVPWPASAPCAREGTAILSRRRTLTTLACAHPRCAAVSATIFWGLEEEEGRRSWRDADASRIGGNTTGAEKGYQWILIYR
jgi:hypothetical protein